MIPVVPHESAEVRLARIEEKIDGLEKRLAERFFGYLGRIEALEESSVRQGKRIGRLERADEQRRGGLAVMAAIWAGAGALGALVFRYFPQGGQ